jgi:ketosteroid isomerase-like protein
MLRGGVNMDNMPISRRQLLVAGASLAAIACTPGSGRGTTNQEIVRKWYAAWEKTDWAPLDGLMADDFTFTSPNGDDHIDKSKYKARCWASQNGLIERFDLEEVAEHDDVAFVRSLCHTKSGKAFRNVEMFRFKNEKVESIECYFGDAAGFPSAANAKKG